MSRRLIEEFEFYQAHQDELVSQYDGKVIVLKDHTVIGVYDSEMAAVTETRRQHDLGTFLVQRVSEGDEAYTRTFRSRVAFP